MHSYIGNYSMLRIMLHGILHRGNQIVVSFPCTARRRKHSSDLWGKFHGQVNVGKISIVRPTDVTREAGLPKKGRKT